MELITTYPAAVNSKATVTMGVLDQATTIVEVLDATVLPEAPNLLVLGTDQTAETVLMTARENNTLTIQRAVQGIAKSWPAGTQIARNFTGKDWDDMRSNVEAIVTKILGLTASDVGALAKIALISDGEYDNKNIDTLGDGVYLYNGWAQAKLICSAGLPFINKTGLWIKKTRYGENGGSDRVDFVINNETGEFFTMYAYNGTWHSGKDLFLPLDGSVPMTSSVIGLLNGYAQWFASENSTALGSFSNVNDYDNRRLFWLNNSNGTTLVDALTLSDVTNGTWSKLYRIFGEHNKPSGSYTGNGSSATRTIDIGGVGNILYITSPYGFGFVTADGGFFIQASYDTSSYVVSYSSSYIKFVDGVLTIKTSNSYVNSSSYAYTYRVL